MNYLQRLRQFITNNRKIVFPVVGLVLVIIAVGLFSLTRSTSTTTSQKQQQQFQNWLKPTSTITVANVRYASPCRVLPPQTVSSIFGELPGTATVDESYLDRSRQDDPTINNYLETSCNYNYAKKSGKLVALTTDQYTDIQVLNYIRLSMNVYPDEVDPVVQRIESATKSSSKQTKQFVTKLKTSAADLKADAAAPKLSDDPASFNGLVVIDPESVDKGVLRMNIKYNNVIYSLRYVPNSGAGLNGNKLSDSQLADIIAQFGDAYDVIIKNAGSSRLDQSPAPTILGSTDKVGQNTILESCSVLDTNAYKTGFGVEDNEPIKRYVMAIDGATVTRDKNGIANRPGNSCYRRFNDNNGTTKEASLSLRTSPSAADAKKSSEALFGDKITPIPVQSSADWAYTYEFTPGDPQRTYYFGVGPYSGTLDISISNSYDDAPDDQQTMQRILDQLVANIKRDQQNISK